METTTKDLVIDDVNYKIHLFAAEQGLKVLTKLIKLVGEPIMELAKGGADQAEIMKNLGGAIRSLAGRLNEEEVVSLMKLLMGKVTVDGEGGNTLDKKFNTYFQGKIGLMFKISVEVVNHNYADFLDVLASAVPEATPAKKV